MPDPLEIRGEVPRLSPEERAARAAERRERELARIFQAGWDDGADDPPLTERQLERLAFLLDPVATARRPSIKG